MSGLEFGHHLVQLIKVARQGQAELVHPVGAQVDHRGILGPVEVDFRHVVEHAVSFPPLQFG